MAGIPGLDVYEIFEPEPNRAVSLRPGSTAQRVPPSAVATRPYQPNWTVPPPAAPAALPAPGPAAMQPDMRGANAARARAQAARAPGTAPVAPAAPAGNMAQRAWRGLRAGAQSTSPTAKALVRGGLPVLAGAGAAGAVNEARQAELDAAPAFVSPEAAPGQIPVDPTLRGPAPVAGRFMDQTELRRNVGNAVMALPGGPRAMAGVSSGLGAIAPAGVSGAAQAGPLSAAEAAARRLLGSAGGPGADIARGAALAAPRVSPVAQGARTAAQAAEAAARGFVYADAAGAGTGTDAAAGPTDGALPQADYSNEGRGSRPFRTPSDGEIVRDGNSYSGTGPIKFGADIVNADGSLRNSADPSKKTGGFGVSSLDTSEGFRQNQMELQRNAAARSEQEAAQQAQIETALRLRPGSSGGFGILDKDYQRERTIKGMDNPRERESMRGQDSAERIASLREEGETGRNMNTQNTLRDVTNVNAASRNRGQDMEDELGFAELGVRQEGFRSTARTATEKAAQEAFYKERDFQTGRADADFTQRGQREAQLQKNIESRTMRQGKNGPEVDANAARRYREGMDRAVGRLGVKGIQDLGPQAAEQLYAASDLLKTIQENAGMLPWNPKALKTIDPLDLTGLKVMPNGDRVITRPGDARGQVIPGRFFQTEEGAMLFGGTPTNRYDILSGGV